MSSGQNNGVLWEFSEWTLAGRCGRMFDQEVCNGPRLGNMDGWLVRTF